MAGTIVEKLRFLLEADASGAIKGFEATGKAADRELGRAQNRLDATGAKLTSFGAKAVAAGGVAGAALFGAAKSFEHLAIEAGKFSDATGLAVEDASRWIEVAGDMGVEAGAVETAIGKFNKTLANSPAKIEELGIEIVRTKDGLTDVNATFLAAIDTINAIPDPTERAAASAALFGKGWQGMAELIASGSDSLRQSLAAVSDAKVINEDELARAKEFRAAMDALSDAGQDLAISIGQGAAPVIGTLARLAGSAGSALSGLNSVSDGAVGQIASLGATALIAGGGISFAAGKVVALRSAIANASPVVLGLTSAIVIGTAAYKAYTSEKDAAKQQTLEYVNALKAERDGLEGATRAAVLNSIAHEDWQKLADELGVSVADLARFIMGEEVPAIKESFNANRFAIRVLEDKRDAFADAVDEDKRMAAAEKDLAPEVENTTDAIEGQVEAAKQLPTMSSGTWMIQTNLRQTEADAKRAKKATEDFEAAVAHLMGFVDDEQALADLDQAFRDVQKAGEEAWNAAATGAKDAEEKRLAYEQGLRDLKRTALETLGDLRERFAGALPKTVETTVLALIDQGKLTHAQAILDALARTRTVSYEPQVGYNKMIAGVRADGGPVSAGKAYVVGEEGPEVFVPGASGAIVPNGGGAPAAAPAAPAGMGGASVTINVNAGLGADGASIGQAVVQAIRDFERRNGRVFAAA